MPYTFKLNDIIPEKVNDHCSNQIFQDCFIGNTTKTQSAIPQNTFFIPKPNKTKYETIDSSVLDPTQKYHCANYGNGLIGSICDAYKHHHRLVLRPDDFWITILIQLSHYINDNSEELRHIFVEHKSQKDIHVDGCNMQDITAQFHQIIKDNLVDKSLMEWMVPKFTTSTTNDIIANHIAIMATVQNYYSCNYSLYSCGIPEITLEGTEEDWIKLRNQLDKLPLFDLLDSSLMTKWNKMLIPIVDELVNTIQQKPNHKFWNSCCQYVHQSCQPTLLCGWVTAFTVFDNKGKWKNLEEDNDVFDDWNWNYIITEYPNPINPVSPWMMTTIEPDLNRRPMEIGDEIIIPINNSTYNHHSNKIMIGLKGYPTYSDITGSVTQSVCEVPVIFHDGFRKVERIFVAGQLFVDVKNDDQIRPRTDWIVLEESKSTSISTLEQIKSYLGNLI
jgi:hypothetical protein